MHVTAEPVSGPLAAPLLVQLVQYQPERLAHITRGENAGQDLLYVNVVDHWQLLQTWDGAGVLELTVSTDAARPAVIVVQQSGPGQVVAVARVD
jgi:hypothetical protein